MDKENPSFGCESGGMPHLWHLTKNHLTELGDVNQNWFEDLTRKSLEECQGKCKQNDDDVDHLQQACCPGENDDERDKMDCDNHVDHSNILQKCTGEPLADNRCRLEGPGSVSDQLGQHITGEGFPPTERRDDQPLQETRQGVPALVTLDLVSPEVLDDARQGKKCPSLQTGGRLVPHTGDVSSPSVPGQRAHTPEQNSAQVDNAALVTTPTAATAPATFTTPAYSPWPTAGGDRDNIAEEFTDDLDTMLAKMLDSEGALSQENSVSVDSDGHTGSHSESLTDHSDQTMTTGQLTHKGFMKRLLLKTPSSGRKGSACRLIRMLGVDPNASGLSWTSSLATPPLNRDTLGGSAVKRDQTCGAASTSADDEEWIMQMGAARKLFCNKDSSDGEDLHSVLDSSLEEDDTEKPSVKPEQKDMKSKSKGLEQPGVDKNTSGQLDHTADDRDRREKGITNLPELQSCNNDVSPIKTKPPRSPVHAPQGMQSGPTDDATKLSNPDKGSAPSKASLSELLQAKAKRYEDLLEGLFNTPPSRNSIQKLQQKRQIKYIRKEAGEDLFLALLNSSTPDSGGNKSFKRKRSEQSLSDVSISSGQSLGFEPVLSDCDTSRGSRDKSMESPLLSAQHASGQTGQNTVVTQHVDENINFIAGRPPSGTPDITFKTPNKRMSHRCDNVVGDSDRKRERSTPAANGDDLFSQLSPTALSAIFEVARETDGDRNLMQVDPNKESNTAEKSCDKHKEGCSFSNTCVPNNTPESHEVCEPGLENNGNDDIVIPRRTTRRSSSSEADSETNNIFSQISPTVLKSILIATDAEEKILSKEDSLAAINTDQSASTPCKTTMKIKILTKSLFPEDTTMGKVLSSVAGDGMVCADKTRHVVVPEVMRVSPTSGSTTEKREAAWDNLTNPGETRLPLNTKASSDNPGIEEPAKQATDSTQRSPSSNAKPLGLRKKAKRFSYPSSTQISKVRPEKVYRFQAQEPCNVTKETSRDTSQNPSDEMVRGRKALVNKDKDADKGLDSHAKIPILTSRKTVKPYWKRYSAGFTTLSVYRDTDNDRDSGRVLKTNPDKQFPEKRIKSSTNDEPSADHDHVEVIPLPLCNQPPPGGSTIDKRITTRGYESASLPDPSKEFELSQSANMRETDSVQILEKCQGTEPEVCHIKPKSNSSGNSQLMMDEVEDEFNKDFFHDVTKEAGFKGIAVGLEEAGPNRVEKNCVAEAGDFVSSLKNHPEFLGFQTATGKNINISSATVTKYSRWLEESLEPDGEQMGTDQEALCNVRSKEKSKETQLSVYHNNINTDRLKVNKQAVPSDSVVCGFESASAKKIAISKESIERFSSLFEDMDDRDACLKGISTSVPSGQPKELNPCNPQTVPQGAVVTSTDHSELPKVDVIPLNHDEIVDTISNKKSHSAEVTTTELHASSMKHEKNKEYSVRGHTIFPKSEPNFGQDVGFRTAGGKQEEDDNESSITAQTIFTKSEPNSADDVGFRTAGGKQLKVSSEAVAKYSKIFDEKDDNKSSITAQTIFTKSEPAFGQDVGFRTAAGKNLKVSSEAVAKNSKIFDEKDDNESSITAQTIFTKSEPDSAQDVGFRTAGGKHLKVSSEAVAKYSKIFDEKDDNESSITAQTIFTKSEPDSAQDVGFRTAGGKHLKVSSEAVAKYCKMFTEDEEQSLGDPLLLNADSARQVGFQTAGGNHVTVSTEAVAKYRNLFEEEELRAVNEDPSLFVEHTGSRVSDRTKVTIWETALAKNSKLLENDLDHMDGLKLSEQKHTSMKVMDLKFSMKSSVKKEKDYSKLPKGFRPFKRPRMITPTSKTANPETTVDANHLLSIGAQVEPTTSQEHLKNTTTHQQQGSNGDSSPSLPSLSPKDPLVIATEDHSSIATTDNFQDDCLDHLTSTQKEALDCTAALLEAEQEFGQTQMAFTQGKAGVMQKDTQSELMDTDKVDTKVVLHASTPAENDKVVTRPFQEEHSVLVSSTHGFNTASGKVINLSAKVIERAKSLMAEVENLSESFSTGIPPQKDVLDRVDTRESEPGKECEPTGKGGSHAGSGPESTVLEETIQRARTSVDLEDATDHLATSCEEHTERTPRENLAETSGNLLPEKATSTQLLSVSEQNPTQEDHTDALVTCKECVHEPRAEEQQLDVEQCRTNRLHHKSPGQFQGFHTASGKTIHVSDQALKEARTLISSLDTEGNQSETLTSRHEIEAERETYDIQEHLSVGRDHIGAAGTAFQTASGHPVRISQVALHLAQGTRGDLQCVPVSVPLAETVLPNTKDESGSDIQEVPNNTTSVRNPIEPASFDLADNTSNIMVGSSKRSSPGESVNSFLADSTVTQQEGVQQEGISLNQLSNSSGIDPYTKRLASTSPGEGEWDPSSAHQIPSRVLQSASGRKVTVSPASLEAVKVIAGGGIEQPSLVQPPACDAVVPENATPNYKPPKSEAPAIKNQFSFTTASGKQVSVSENALLRAKSMLSEIDGHQTLSKAMDVKVPEASDFIMGVASPAGINTLGGQGDWSGNILCAFQSASGKEVTISEESMREVKSMFAGPATVEHSSKDLGAGDSLEMLEDTQIASEMEIAMLVNESGMTGCQTISKCDDLQGFKTTSGGRVPVFLSTREPANVLLVDDPSSSNKPHPNQDIGGEIDPVQGNCSRTDSTKGFLGFQTTMGVDKDSKSQEPSRELLQDGHPRESSASTTTPRVPSGFQGFTTARGTKVDISREALKQAQKLLLETEDQGKVPSVPPAFSTAVFEDSSDHSNKHSVLIPGKCEYSRKDTESDDSKNLGKSFLGFKTAKGTKVTISDKALRAAQQLMADVEDSSPKQQESFVDQTKGNSMPHKPQQLMADVEDSSLKQQESFGDQTKWKDMPQNPKVPVAFQGFETAKGTKVTISDKALRAAQQLMADVEDSSSKQEESLVDETKQKDMVQNPKVPVAFKGFETAKGTKVTISDKALRAAQQLVADVEDSSPKQQESFGDQTKWKDIPQNPKVPVAFKGFETAKGTKVTISDKALRAAQQLMADVEDSSSKQEESLVDQTKGNSMPQKSQGPAVAFKGFETAKGTKVTISDKALRAAQQLMTQVKDSSPKQQESFVDETKQKHMPQNPKVPVAFKGFETAKGTKVTISDKALRAAQQLMTQVKDSSPKQQESFVDETKQKHMPQNPKVPVAFKGFETAKGTKVTISDKALRAAQQLMAEVEDSSLKQQESFVDQTEQKDMPSQGPAVAFKGFETAKGTKVTISDKALRAAQQLMTEVEYSSPKQQESFVDETKQKHMPQNPKVPVAFKGFETAKGTKVAISDKALRAAQQLMVEREDSLSEQQKSFGEQSKAESPSMLKKNTDREGRNIKEVLDSHRSFGGKGTDQPESDAVMKEVSESSKALLADGDEMFGEEMPTARQDQRTFTPVDLGQRRRLQDQAVRSAPGRRMRPWMKPVITTPEGLITDRWSVQQSSVHHPVLTAPHSDPQPKDTGLRWEGRSSVITERQRNGGDRASFCSHTSPLLQCSGRPTTPHGIGSLTILPISQSTPVSSRQTSFNTPYRRCPQPVGTATPSRTKTMTKESSFKTPVKPNIDASSGHPRPPACTLFRTPTKTPSGVPQKRTLSDAGFMLPLQKKPKCEDIVDEPVDSDAEWGSMDDSMNEAMISADLTTLDAPINAAAGQNNPNTGPQEDSKSVNSGQTIDDRSEASRNDIPGAMSPNVKRLKVPEEVVKQRLQAKVAQGQRIRQKKEEGGVKPQPGRLFSQKCLERGLPLKAAVGGQRPQHYSPQQLYACGIHMSTYRVKASTAEDFMFAASEHYSEEMAMVGDGVRVGDGALLIWNSQGCAGKDEFCNALLDLTAVDPKLISREWVHNHYRWIVWKLAAMETAYPLVFGGSCLTPDRMMHQLKYRYDREVDNSHRSAVKKIFERDDTPARTLILCVAAVDLIHNISASTAKDSEVSMPKLSGNSTVELTDGWYAIRALLDPALIRLVRAGCLKVGDKICVYGAELIGSQEAAPPLEASADTMLKICANSTRRARWDARLGYHRNPQPAPLPLSSLYPDGGMVACVDVIVTRVYPIQYMERRPDGSTIFRSERTEQRAACAFEKERQHHLEAVYAILQAEFESRAAGTDRRRSRRSAHKWSRHDIEKLGTGQEIYEMLQSATDPSAIESFLSDQQMVVLTDHRRHLQDELHNEMQAEFKVKLEEFEEKKPNRNVVPLLKVRLAGCATKDIDSSTRFWDDVFSDTLLTVWRPSDGVREMLVEGTRFLVFNVGAAEGRGRMKGTGVTLTAQRMTRYQTVPVDDNFLDLIYEPREVTDFSELTEHFQTSCGEIDAVGVVVHLSQVTSFDRASGDEGQLQMAYLADNERSLAAVKIWGGIAAHSLEDVMKPGVMVALTNLQLRPDSTRGRLPALVLGDLSAVSTNPREGHLQVALARLRTCVKADSCFLTDMQKELHEVLAAPPCGSKWQQTPGRSLTRSVPHRTPVSTSTTVGAKHETPHNVKYPNQRATPPSALPYQGHTQRPQMSASHGRSTPQPGYKTDAQGRSPMYCANVLPSVDQIMTTPPSGSTRHYKAPGALSAGFDQARLESVTTPNSVINYSSPLATNEDSSDPLVAKKKTIQKCKLQKLSQYADPAPVTPLHTPISHAVRKAFKAPAMNKTLSSPLLSDVTKTQPLRQLSPKEATSGILSVKEMGNTGESDVKLERRLDYGEQDLQGPGASGTVVEGRDGKDTGEGEGYSAASLTSGDKTGLSNSVTFKENSKTGESVIASTHPNDQLGAKQTSAITQSLTDIITLDTAPTQVKEASQASETSSGRGRTRGKRRRTEDGHGAESNSKRRSSLRLLKQR